VEHGEIPGKADECEHDILTGLILWSSAKMNQIPCLGVIMIAAQESLRAGATDARADCLVARAIGFSPGTLGSGRTECLSTRLELI
jgi:hypothetical protein